MYDWTFGMMDCMIEWIPSVVVGVDLWKVKLVVIGLRLGCIVLPRGEKGLKKAKCYKLWKILADKFEYTLVSPVHSLCQFGIDGSRKGFPLIQCLLHSTLPPCP